MSARTICILALVGQFITSVIHGIPANETEERKDFSGCQLLVISPSSEDDVSVLHTLYKQELDGTDFWNLPAGPTPGPLSNATVMVCQTQGQVNFTKALHENGLKYIVHIENLQRLIEEERMEHELLGRFDKNSAFQSFAFDQYHTLTEVEDFLHLAEQEYPELLTVTNTGKTFRGNDIKIVKLGEKSAKNKPTIWIDSGIHSREWVTISSSLYIINKLLTSYNESDRTGSPLSTFDIHWAPVLNPDGYHYTWEKDRFWRKNRSKAHLFCAGVDLNRNFGTDFHGEQTSSTNPCSQLYKGKKAFSEIETTIVKDYVESLKGSLQAFMTLHSYSQLWLLPYGYKKEKPEDYDDMLSLAKLATESMRRVHGMSYRYGVISEILYPTSGSSSDWAYDTIGVKYSYALELRDTGRYGFMLPRSQIIPTAEELFEALSTLMTEIAKRENLS